MPKSFAVPIPENLDEELALEDQRQQRRRAARAASDSGASRPVSEGPGISSNHNSFGTGTTAAIDCLGAAPRGSNESMASKSSDERPEPVLLPIASPADSLTRSSDADAVGIAALFRTTSNASDMALSRNNSSPGSPMRARLREIRGFCSFLHGRKEVFVVKLRDGSRGADLVDALIKAFLQADPQLRGKWSEDPREYKLYTAEDTGEEEFPVSLEAPCAHFTNVALKPLAGAQLNKFPQMQQMLPTVADDITFSVNVIGAPGKRIVQLPADLLADRLEEVLTEKLHLSDVESRSLVVHYGPAELSLNQPYGFGAGGERSDPPLVKERTLLSLYRFGVKEFSIKATVSDNAPMTPLTDASLNSTLGSFRKVDEEEAKTYRQFEVVKTNKFGAKQERVLGVDAERIYNMKPGSEVGRAKNPERQIADIQQIRVFPDRPTYFEIEYVREDTDRIEARNALECSLLVEKLRVLTKLHQHSREQKDKAKGHGVLSFFSEKLGLGK